MTASLPLVDVKPFAAVANRLECLAAMDSIFFEASATKSFADEAARAAFHERWLGRYLTRFPDCAFVAITPEGRVLGYIVGATSDPVRNPLFADISYLPKFAHLTARYPAHLHINLDAAARNRGIGGRLIDTFCDQARRDGAQGVHAVTAKQSRNRSFYARQGFTLVAETTWNGHEIVFLGRCLFASASA